MPTFIAYVLGNRHQDLKGADKNGLERLIEQTVDFYESTIKRQREAIEEKKRAQKSLQESPLEETEDELMKMSVKILKQMILDRGWSLAGLAEKTDLVKKLLKKE
jgi:hypothetical protein